MNRQTPHLRSARLRTYRDATAFLESLIRTPPRTRAERERLGLSPIKSLLERIGNPHHGLAAIHIVGSKGKGSTALYTEAVLSAAGRRTGTFTSPHLQDWTERIRIAGAPIDHARFIKALERIRPAVAELHQADADTAPTFFDALVAAAFSVFADASVDIAVVEAGIGARLDPTRTCRAVATCMTGVELEHTDRLGPAITDIAREKAAVVRPGIPLVASFMQEEAWTVVEREANRVGAPLLRLGRDITIRPSRDDGAARAPGGLAGSVVPTGSSTPTGSSMPIDSSAPTGSSTSTPDDHHRHEMSGQADSPADSFTDTGAAEIVLSDRTIPVALRQPGRHMRENAALALALANEVGALHRLDDTAAGAALEAAVLPGRTEVVREAPFVIVDGAHTRASIEALVEVLGARGPAGLAAVVSVTRGKDAAHVLSPLVERASTVIATAAEPSRSVPAETLADTLRESAPHASIESITDPSDALRAAMRFAGPDGTVCAAGSMYMAGAARRIILAE